MNNVFFFNWQEQQTQDRKLDKVMISSIMSSRTPRWDLWQWSLWSRISQSWTEGFTGNAIPVENPYQLMDWCRNDERIEPEIFGFSPFFFGVAVVFAQWCAVILFFDNHWPWKYAALHVVLQLQGCPLAIWEAAPVLALEKWQVGGTLSQKSDTPVGCWV